MRHAVAPTLLSLCLRASLLGLASAPLLAQAAGQPFQIAAGPLEQALNSFASQAGILLSYDPQLSQGRQAPPLHGDYAIADGLAQLLAGSGLRAVRSTDGSYHLELAAEQGQLQLQSLSVMAELDSPVGEDRGYVAYNSRSASKTNTPLAATPRSVSVVTQQQLKDRNSQTISDALRYSAGIQGGYFGEDNKQDWFILRGFKQANNGLFQDGVRVYSSGFYSWQVDPYLLERVEVLKGASSVLYGQSTPGGIINLQSKRPNAEARNEVGLQYGSFSRQQLHFDVGSDLDSQGSMRFRLVGLSRDTGTQVEQVDSERLLLAPSLRIDFAEDSSLTLLASWQQDNSQPQLQFLPAEGSLWATGNGRIADDVAVGNPAYEKFDRRQFNIGYELNHRLDEHWDFQQNMRYGKLDVELRQMYYAGHAIDLLNRAAGVLASRLNLPFDTAFALASGALPDLNDPSRRTIMRGLTYTDGQADNLSLDNRLLQHWSQDNLESTLLLGLDYQQLHIDEQAFASDPLIREPLDIYQPIYPAGTSLINSATLAPLSAADLQHKQTRPDQLGLYLQHQLKLDERWVSQLAMRYDDARSDLNNRSSGVNKSLRDHAMTWSAGLAYLADHGLTPYASYSEFFLPVTDINPSSGEPYQPEQGEQYEVGVKYLPEQLDASVSLALFELTQDNVRKNGSHGVRTQLGQVRSRGVELEASADLSPQLQLTGALTLLDAQTRRSTLAAEQGRRPSQVAERLASLWAVYHFDQGPLSGFNLGMGARYTGASYGDNQESAQLRVPSFTVYDAMLSYRLDDLTLQLNANNLTDKQYIATCDYYCWYGNRRNLIASLSYAW